MRQWAKFFKLKSTVMKNVLQKIACTFFVAMFVASCSDSSQDKMKQKADTLAAKVENKVDEVKDDMKQRQDENFVKDVIHANAKELHLLELAAKKGTAKDVRDAAKKMQPDHEKLGEAFHNYAAGIGVVVDADSTDMQDKMDDDKVGADWDRNWVDKMVDGHQKMVNKFEEHNVNDPELKKMVTESLPTLRSHLDMARAIQDKMKK